MRILLGNQTLALLAGSETWTSTLARALKAMGHEVTCFSPALGVISAKLENDGIRCIDDVGSSSGAKPFSIVLEPAAPSDFDFIISNHHDITTILRDRFPSKTIVSTIHGVLHTTQGPRGETLIAPEHPAIGKADIYVAVSEEVQAKLMADYGIKSVIIRNFFDLEAFLPVRTPSEGRPKQFLVNTNYAGRDDREIKLIKEVAAHYGARVAAVGQNFTQTDDVRRAIEDADVVFGMGRSVLEGVAMGRLGIVHGRWGTGGVVNEKNIDVLRACNFSGRNSGGDFWTKERMIEEIDANYKPEVMSWGVGYVAREHNVKKSAQEYIMLGSAVRTEKPPAPAPLPKLKFQSHAA
jgi:hypothetical protein